MNRRVALLDVNVLVALFDPDCTTMWHTTGLPGSARQGGPPVR